MQLLLDWLIWSRLVLGCIVAIGSVGLLIYNFPTMFRSHGFLAGVESLFAIIGFGLSAVLFAVSCFTVYVHVMILRTSNAFAIYATNTPASIVGAIPTFCFVGAIVWHIYMGSESWTEGTLGFAIFLLLLLGFIAPNVVFHIKATSSTVFHLLPLLFLVTLGLATFMQCLSVMDNIVYEIKSKNEKMAKEKRIVEELALINTESDLIMLFTQMGDSLDDFWHVESVIKRLPDDFIQETNTLLEIGATFSSSAEISTYEQKIDRSRRLFWELFGRHTIEKEARLKTDQTLVDLVFHPKIDPTAKECVEYFCHLPESKRDDSTFFEELYNRWRNATKHWSPTRWFYHLGPKLKEDRTLVARIIKNMPFPPQAEVLYALLGPGLQRDEAFLTEILVVLAKKNDRQVLIDVVTDIKIPQTARFVSVRKLNEDELLAAYKGANGPSDNDLFFKYLLSKPELFVKVFKNLKYINDMKEFAKRAEDNPKLLTEINQRLRKYVRK